MSHLGSLRDKIIFPLINYLPRNLRTRLKMAGTCLLGRGWEYFQIAPFTEEFETLSEKEVEELYRDLSPRSIGALLDYLKYCHLSTAFRKYLDLRRNDSIIVPMENLFPGLREMAALEEKVCRRLVRKTCFDHLSPESACYHHGLKFVDPAVLEYIRGKVFLDLGAYIGDSAFVLAGYGPEKILAFEPSPENGRICSENMKKENIDCVEVVSKGVSDEPGELFLEEGGSETSLNGGQGGVRTEVVTVDGFLKRSSYGKIGVIKADLEGMGFRMIKGAIETIKKDRPVLLLAMYHNRDEFMEMYRFLRANTENYEYKVEALCGICEVTLIAWPGEIAKNS